MCKCVCVHESPCIYIDVFAHTCAFLRMGVSLRGVPATFRRLFLARMPWLCSGKTRGGVI